MKKRPTYRDAVAWIAENDEPLETDEAAVASFLTTVLIADLFGVPEARVAADVMRHRDRAHRQAVRDAKRLGYGA